MECFCWEHVVPLVLTDTLCTICGCAAHMAESCLGFDEKWEYLFTVHTAMKQGQNVHHHRGNDIKLWLSSGQPKNRMGLKTLFYHVFLRVDQWELYT